MINDFRNCYQLLLYPEDHFLERKKEAKANN